MTQFNYQRAWLNLAAPIYNGLDPALHALMGAAAQATAGVSQNRELGIDWPEGLRPAFERFSDEAIALAGHVSYITGHWMPPAPLIEATVDVPGRD